MDVVKALCVDLGSNPLNNVLVVEKMQSPSVGHYTRERERRRPACDSYLRHHGRRERGNHVHSDFVGFQGRSSASAMSDLQLSSAPRVLRFMRQCLIRIGPDFA